MSARWFERLLESPAVAALVALAEGGGSTSVRGVGGSSTSVLAGLLRRLTRRPVLLVTAHLDEADEAHAELQGLGFEAALLPALESLPGEQGAVMELTAARLTLAERLHAGAAPQILVAPIASLMQPLPDAATLPSLLRTISAGEAVPPRILAEWLAGAGYQRTALVEHPGEFSVRGGVIDVYPPGGAPPVRLDFFGDQVERIFEVDPGTQASDRSLERTLLVSALPERLQQDTGTVQPVALAPAGSVALLAELAEITEQARGYWERVHDARGITAPPAVMKALLAHCHAVIDVNAFSAVNAASRVVHLPVRPLAAFPEDVPAAFAELARIGREAPAWLLCDTDGELARARELLASHAEGAPVLTELRHLHRGFHWQEEGGPELAMVPEHEVLHRWGVRRRRGGPGLGGGRTRDAFIQFQPGDFVVHRDHGIALYVGLTTLPESGRSDEEFLTLEFEGGSRLHVPAVRVELVQKYVGAGGAAPPRSLLGGKRWKRQREQVQEAVRDLAAELLRVQAARDSMPGIAYPEDTVWQREFEAEFPWDETEDQLAAIAAIKKDMGRPRPMDRLVCGDVGFGKTEVAIRAAFKAVEAGKQVAVLVPTTVLAEQHERTFRERFAGYPFRIESLSRFKTGAEQRVILEEAALGRVDVLVGTHRLLSRDVRLKDLGLVIVDEEQRFGVEHKQRLLEFRLTADVLTLSATPIPRTLHMALLGLRDISSLTTPPLDRRAIVTEVIPWNDRRIQQALRRELARDGQVFFVHNRVRSIHRIADRVQALVPEARIVVGHGQMEPAELEEVMLRFMRRQADVLVSTTIIESGLDIPSANTMFIDDAAIYGLADLHQLRGRVGRSRHRAYCYLLLDPDRVMTQDAMKRLKAIEDYSMLGAGFKIAMRDLEIRGAGNLLGAEQSGHIAAVGYEMYCRLLEEAVEGLQHAPKARASEVALELGVQGTIPRGWIPSDQRRLEAYRRIAAIEAPQDLERVAKDLESAYGTPPAPVQLLLALAEIRVHLVRLGIASVQLREADLVFRSSDPQAIQRAFQGMQGSVRVVPLANAPAAPSPGGDGDGLRGGVAPGAPGAPGACAAEVFVRPPKAFLEPATLLSVLRKRLAAQPASHSLTK